MISGSKGHTRIHYRVDGVAIQEDQVLLYKAEIDDFWIMPGEWGELLETAEKALRLECSMVDREGGA
jgi:ADP-ribose pyrophosphatase YjhB (NUDIX family)